MSRAGRIVSCALALAACAREAPAPAGMGTVAAGEAGAVPAAFADTLRGTLRITGPEPGVTFVVVDAAGGAVAVEGDRAVLERLSGLEIAVRGARGPAAFRVDDVAVRAANGVPAVDGLLVAEGGRYALVVRGGGRLPVARLPEALRGQVGAWVWLAGPLDGDIDSFGVIAGGR